VLKRFVRVVTTLTGTTPSVTYGVEIVAERSHY
jgi:hypothetical protein